MSSNQAVKEMSERCDRSKANRANRKVESSPPRPGKLLRGRLNDSIKLHPLHGRQWRLGAVDMRLHDAERLAKPKLQVLKLNSNDDIILQTTKSVTRLISVRQGKNKIK